MNFYTEKRFKLSAIALEPDGEIFARVWKPYASYTNSAPREIASLH
jgi:hypothetical protein